MYLSYAGRRIKVSRIWCYLIILRSVRVIWYGILWLEAIVLEEILCLLSVRCTLNLWDCWQTRLTLNELILELTWLTVPGLQVIVVIVMLHVMGRVWQHLTSSILHLFWLGNNCLMSYVSKFVILHHFLFFCLNLLTLRKVMLVNSFIQLWWPKSFNAVPLVVQ